MLRRLAGRSSAPTGSKMPGLQLTRNGVRNRSRRRGAEMLEFAILFPFFLFMILFTIDMGHVVLVTGQVQDAGASAARYGAQLGGAGTRSQTVFTDTIDRTPGLQASKSSMTVESGSICARTGPNTFVALRATYDVPLIAPGLGALLNLTVGNDGPSGTWRTTANAVSRCEIVVGVGSN